MSSTSAVLSSLLLVTLVAQATPAASPPSTEQVRFGITVARKGLWAEARFRFERALELDPKNAAAWNNLAIACEQQGDFAKARESYEAALKIKPGHRHIQQNYDLFREADSKRNRGSKVPASASR